ATTDVLSDKVKNEVMSWIPMQRFGEPDEIAPIAAFLSREEARYITGEIIRVDGGMAI
ncbi:MAG: SDR family oxidoreductase, partial [Chloroflexota bacterium]|nr:SDR family oxidoreductase [Chloroflexota bacterium]